MENPLNKNNYFMSRRLQPELNRNYKWLINSGILLIILGLSAIVSNIYFYLPIIGISLLLAGIITITHAIKFWCHKIAGLTIHFALGVLYCLTGIMNLFSFAFMFHILFLSITAIYLIAGLFRIMSAIIEGIAIAGWLITFLLGIVNVIFAIFIWHTWQNFIMHELVTINGIDIAMTGLALFMLGFNILKIKERLPHGP
jgi:uncharacterized membrane protein HdeD (DUF308 family)